MARLRREAALGMRLAHPNVCHIMRLGETEDGLVYAYGGAFSNARDARAFRGQDGRLWFTNLGTERDWNFVVRNDVRDPAPAAQYEPIRLSTHGHLQAINAEQPIVVRGKVIQGLQGSRGADQPFVSILAHSYGSTAALRGVLERYAAAGGRVARDAGVDDLHTGPFAVEPLGDQ